MKLLEKLGALPALIVAPHSFCMKTYWWFTDTPPHICENSDVWSPLIHGVDAKNTRWLLNSRPLKDGYAIIENDIIMKCKRVSQW